MTSAPCTASWLGWCRTVLSTLASKRPIQSSESVRPRWEHFEATRCPLGTIAAALHGAVGAASAQVKPLRLIVPYRLGGPLDLIARALAEKVKDSLGVVIVDNRRRRQLVRGRRRSRRTAA